jgi:hypothetical protein
MCNCVGWNLSVLCRLSPKINPVWNWYYSPYYTFCTKGILAYVPLQAFQHTTLTTHNLLPNFTHILPPMLYPNSIRNTWGKPLGTFEDINVNFGKQQCNFCCEYISVISLQANNLNTCYRPQIPHNSTLRGVYTQWPKWVGLPNYRPAALGRYLLLKWPMLGMCLLLNNDLFKKQWCPCVTSMRFLKTFSYQFWS